MNENQGPEKQSPASTEKVSRRQFLHLGAATAFLGLLDIACQVSGMSGGTTVPGANGATVVPTTSPSANPLSGNNLWRGIIRDQRGMPLANARVTLISGDNRLFYETRSNDTGLYAIPDAPVGDLTLGVSAPGYEYQEALTASGLDFSLGHENHPGHWEVIGDTEPERFGGTNSGALMPDGRLIFCHNTIDPMLFNPVTGDKRLASPSPSTQGCHMISYLPDGRIFYIGGGDVDAEGNFNNISVNFVKAYDPESDHWEVLPSLSEKRWYPGLTPLADGRYLIFGGGGQPENIRIASCEIYDPRTQQWKPTGSLTAAGGFGPTALLYTGQPFVAWWPPQLYDMTTGQWRNTGLLNQTLRSEVGSSIPIPADHPDFSTILLDDGRVVVIGIRRTAGTNMVEIYDPNTEQWSIGANPAIIRSMPEVLRLPTGKILVAGGRNESNSHEVFTNHWGQTQLTDLYDPVTDSWHVMAELKNAREYHALTILLPDGRVVTAAGTAQPGLNPPPEASKEIEAFSPPYLFRGPRPQIVSVSKTQFSRGESISLEVTQTAAITSLILLGLNAVTHWMDGGPGRRVALSFSQNGQTITAEIPADPSRAIPGFYHLLALVDDIPSTGIIVQVI